MSTRQTRWQNKQRERGRCIRCGRHKHGYPNASYCARCHAKVLANRRRKRDVAVE